MQDALAVDTFERSEEAFAAEALFDAYRAGTDEEIKQCINKKSIFMDLDNQVQPDLYSPEVEYTGLLSEA